MVRICEILPIFLHQEMMKRILRLQFCGGVRVSPSCAGNRKMLVQETYLLVEGFPTSWSEVRKSSLGPLFRVGLDGWIPTLLGCGSKWKT